uniref:Uncharacterized protein n=1 Tax=Chromera velia CCMP2878 TaxID=1169474 RepID=A0A0G4HVZ2_9ALVE|eukprot:Cvel_8895.t1-p1 / transcript=Cvel_8895.t1 / gene=Cvel_8895 / organism=Chromera_velia_CCMP2878 / gene_product=hypothetical protein / transcript_product=hypothetical protein / location=Cvel_scaffold500:65150-74741(+) / protein_length=360 / sequence_SO=supercontig / SO=protein_coding / is_pseudo=false
MNPSHSSDIKENEYGRSFTPVAPDEDHEDDAGPGRLDLTHRTASRGRGGGSMETATGDMSEGRQCTASSSFDRSIGKDRMEPHQGGRESVQQQQQTPGGAVPPTPPVPPPPAVVSREEAMRRMIEQQKKLKQDFQRAVGSDFYVVKLLGVRWRCRTRFKFLCMHQGKKLALKEMSVEDMKEEDGSLRQVQGEGVVQLVRSGELPEGRAFLAMEYIEHVQGPTTEVVRGWGVDELLEGDEGTRDEASSITSRADQMARQIVKIHKLAEDTESAHVLQKEFTEACDANNIEQVFDIVEQKSGKGRQQKKTKTFHPRTARVCRLLAAFSIHRRIRFFYSTFDSKWDEAVATYAEKRRGRWRRK